MQGQQAESRIGATHEIACEDLAMIDEPRKNTLVPMCSPIRRVCKPALPLGFQKKDEPSFSRSIIGLRLPACPSLETTNQDRESNAFLHRPWNTNSYPQRCHSKW